MPRKHLFEPSTAETVIAYGVHVKGNLECENDLWVDGIINGNIRAHGNVSVGVNAKVEGTISATSINIAGQVIGNIKAREKLNMAMSGRLIGDVRAAGLAVADGAVLVGQISMPDGEGPKNDQADENSPKK